MSDLAEILKDETVRRQFMAMPPAQRAAYGWRMQWLSKAHRHQILPTGDWWSVWLLLAGRGAGKTRTAAEQLAWWAWTEPNTRWLVGAPTSADVRATCFEGDSGLMSVIPPILIKDYNRAFHEITLINGSLIKGIPASEPERFRGPQFHGGWCDELAAWDYLDAAWDQINFSVRLGKHTRLICTTTPRPKDLIIDLIGRDGDDVVVTTASTYDNIANLSSNFQKQIMQYEGTKLGRQEIYAEILDPEESGIVKREMFKLWPNGREFPKFEYIIQSYDCAYTEKTVNDPTACITFGMFKPLDGPMSVMVIDAWQDRLQYPDLRPKVIDEYDTIFGEGKEKKRVDLILVEDKSAGISLIQDLQRAHLPVRAYNPGRADKMQRLNIVSNIIARGRVWIPESGVRKGFVRDWAEGFVSQNCSFPEATHDDYVDACLVGETLIQMADGTTKRIDAVVVGDIVATPDGSQPVTAVFSNGVKEIWEVDAGAKLYGTGNHNVMTNTGWIHIDKLIPSVDTVYTYQQEESWYSKAKKVWLSKQLSSMVKGITVTLKAAARHIADTFQGLAQGFTGMSGFTTTASSQPATMSTTLTGTQVTTISQTSSVCQQDNIGTSTKQSYPHGINQTGNYATSKASGVRPLNGTVQQKVWLGIRSMSLSLWQKLGVSQRFILSWLSIVSGAASKALQKLLGRFFVAQAVKQPSQSSALVRAVTNTHTMRQVYDLTVANEHCYYANGILVHNCTQALRYLRDAGWLEIDAPPRDDYDEEDLIDSGMMTTRVNPYAA
jgi:phage terminase large subunit-like protein